MSLLPPRRRVSKFVRLQGIVNGRDVDGGWQAASRVMCTIAGLVDACGPLHGELTLSAARLKA